MAPISTLKSQPSTLSNSNAKRFQSVPSQSASFTDKEVEESKKRLLKASPKNHRRPGRRRRRSYLGGERPLQARECKYLRGVFTSEMERESRFGGTSVVLQVLHRAIVVKKEPSHKGKLSIYRSVYVPSLTYAQQAEMRSLWRAAGLSLGGRARSLKKKTNT